MMERDVAYPGNKRVKSNTKQNSASAERLKNLMDTQFNNNTNVPSYELLQSKSEAHAEYIKKQKLQHELYLKEKEKKNFDLEERRQQIMYARDMKMFLKQDSYMLLPKFFVISDIPNYIKNLQAKSGLNDATGIYIICNVTNHKCYVGQHQTVFIASHELFLDSTISKNYVADIKTDFDMGNKFAVNFVKLSATKFDTLNELCAHYIKSYNSIRFGYNNTINPKSKHQWCSY